MYLTEEIINNMSSKEYKIYRKEIKSFFKQKERDILYTGNIEFIPKKVYNNPWLSHLKNIKDRCDNLNSKNYKYYGKKGIKNFLTIKDVEFLYKRDNAKFMIKPSIDRIDNNGHYELNNCCFIEFDINAKKSNKILLTYDKDYVNKITFFKYKNYLLYTLTIKNQTYITLKIGKNKHSFKTFKKLKQFLISYSLNIGQFRFLKEKIIK